MRSFVLIATLFLLASPTFGQEQRRGGSGTELSGDAGKKGLERRSSSRGSLLGKMGKGFKAVGRSTPAKVLPTKPAFKGPSKDFDPAAPPSSTDATPAAPSIAEPRPAALPKPKPPSTHTSVAAQQLHKKDDDSTAPPSSTSQPDHTSKASDAAKKEDENPESSSRTSTLFTGAKKALAFLNKPQEPAGAASTDQDSSPPDAALLSKFIHWGPMRRFKDEALQVDEQEEPPSS